jgi:ribose transport system permease protein
MNGNPSYPARWPRLPGLSGPLLGLLGILLIFLCILFSQGKLKQFLSADNLQGILHESTVRVVVALGMLLIVITGGIDLSVGSVVALVTVVTMQVFRLVAAETGSQTLASCGAISAGICTGGLCGLLNGVGVTVLRVTPFVVTLGMDSVARGLAYWLSGKTKISFPAEVPGWVTALQVERAGYLLVDPGVWSAAILSLAVGVLLNLTVLGRYVFAIGGSEAAALHSGIAVDRHKTVVYTLAGLLTGWAGVLVFAQSNSGDPTPQLSLVLDVIAAVVIGGASLSGGRGTVPGTLLGVLILSLLDNAINFCEAPVEVQYILTGAIVVVYTALSQWQRRRSE